MSGWLGILGDFIDSVSDTFHLNSEIEAIKKDPTVIGAPRLMQVRQRLQRHGSSNAFDKEKLDVILLIDQEFERRAKIKSA